MSESVTSGRVLVIGLDSFEARLAEKWIAEGLLPNLAAFYHDSLVTPIANPKGFESGAIWATFFTGSDVDQHGFYNGNRYFDPQTYEVKPSLEFKRELNPLWYEISDAGKRSIFIDPPYQIPPDNHAGIFVADWCAHFSFNGQGELRPESWPAVLIDEIDETYGPDPLGGKSCDNHSPRTAKEVTWFRDALVKRVQMKADLTVDLMGKGDWDFCMPVFVDAHCVGHRCLHLSDPSHPNYDAAMAQKTGDPVRDVYVALDRAVGQILDAAPPDATVFVYWSHGMGIAYSGTRLLDRILVALEGDYDPTRDTVNRYLQSVWRTLPAGVRKTLYPLKARVRRFFFGPGTAKPPQNRRFFETPVNDATGGIRINLKGREARGIVEPGDEYEAVCAQIIKDLSEITNDDTGEPLVERICMTRDIYDGPKLGRLPDILATWKRDKPIVHVSSPKVDSIRHPEPNSRSGDHTPDGTILAKGPGLSPGRLNEPTSAANLAPTLAVLTGVDPTPFEGEPIEALTHPRRQQLLDVRS